MNAPLYRSLNPATGDLFGSFALHGDAEVEAGLARSWSAWGKLRAMTVADSSRIGAR